MPQTPGGMERRKPDSPGSTHNAAPGREKTADRDGADVMAVAGSYPHTCTSVNAHHFAGLLATKSVIIIDCVTRLENAKLWPVLTESMEMVSRVPFEKTRVAFFQ